MSEPQAAQRAIDWLEAQLVELMNIRNATPRDPSFKNWRQATLTMMQRIWPGDQTRSERFRRIPFSPADPRADTRTVREWYSRGCQEAARILRGFIEEIRASGVLENPGEPLPEPIPSEFEDGIPTVDLPEGDLGESTSTADMTDNLLADLADIPPQGSYPASAEPPRIHVDVPPPPAPEPPVLTSPVEAAAAASADAAMPEPPSAKKPWNMKSRLRDLLGFAHLSAKALAGFPREAPEEGQAAPPPPPLPGPPELDMLPIGDEVVPEALPAPPVLSEPGVPQPAWPVPQPHSAPAPTLPPGAVSPLAAAAPDVPSAEAPPESVNSVTMSRTTTLRGNIEKVSIDSLISPEFRSPGEAATREGSPTTSEPKASEPGLTQGPAAPEPKAPKVAEPFASEPEAAETVAEEPAAREPVTEAPIPPPPVARRPTLVEPPAAPVAEAPVPPPVAKRLKLVESPPARAAEAQATPAPAAKQPGPESPASAAPPPVQPPGETPRAGSRPPLKVVRPFVDDPEFSMDSSPSAEMPAPRAELPGATESPSARQGKPAPKPGRGRPTPRSESEAEPAAPEPTDDSRSREMDREALARETEKFMHGSPVLGATGRRVRRELEGPGFEDPDAIGVASMAQDLARLGVPAERQLETRARLMDLARRLERGELEWSALRKAMWFAMEYPEIARRLVPVLLPWIDRAA